MNISQLTGNRCSSKRCWGKLVVFPAVLDSIVEKISGVALPQELGELAFVHAVLRYLKGRFGVADPAAPDGI